MRISVKSFLVLFLSPVFVFSQQRDLSFYIEKAKANSTLINQNENEKKLVELDLEQLRRIYSRPEVTLEAGLLFAPIIVHENNTNRLKMVSGDVDSYSGYDLGATDGGQYQAMLSLNQGLFNGKKLQTYAEKAEVQKKINDNAIELTVHELENVVNHQYILCLKAEKQAAGSLSLIKEVEDEISVMGKLVNSAIYKKSDLALLEITRQNYLQEYESYRAEFKANVYDLNLICGITDDSEVALSEVWFQQNGELNTASRFLTLFMLDSLSIASELKISELKYKPQLSLFANTGLNAVYQPSFNRMGLSAGLTFSMTLFDGNQREIERQKSEISQQTLSFEKQKAKDQNSIQKNYTMEQIRSLNKRIGLADAQLKQYDELLKMYKAQLNQGDVSVMDYKYLLKDISEKSQEKLMLEMEKQLVINAYNYWNY